MENLTHDPAVKAPGVPSEVLDSSWLGKWIQPDHLTAEALAHYNNNYHADGIRYLRISQFLLPKVADSLYQFLDSEAAYEEIYGLYEPDAKVSREEWLAADVANRMYKFSKMTGVRQDVRSFNPILFTRFREAVSEARFVRFFERVAGIQLGEVLSFGGSAYGVDDYLRPHHDALKNRRVAYIIYLTPDWKPEYGGALHIVGHHDEEHVLEVEFNSMVMFDVYDHKYHYIADITEAAGKVRRLTLGGWIADIA